MPYVKAFTDLDVPIKGRGVTFMPADHELTDDEIEQQYGLLMNEAVAAFVRDIDYIIEMAETATKIARRDVRPPTTQLPAEIVQRIRTERASGRTWVQIAQRLNLDKIPTARGRRWNPKSVANAHKAAASVG